jgi:uridine kinase
MMNLKRYTQFFFQTITEHRALFFTGLFIKILCGCLLASGFMTQLFAPFINYAVSEDPVGVYTHFSTQGRGTEFPYPPLMMILLGIPRFILGIFFPPETGYISFADIAALRVTIFIADTVILFILLRWLKQHTRKVMWLYWLSPVFLYINYIHGQLDVIPVCLLFLALYALFKKQFITTCLLLAFAICCKTSMLLALPFILIYGYKHPAIATRTWITAITAMVVCIVLINLPYIGQAGFRQMVYNNREQAKLFATALPLSAGGLFLVTPAVYLLLVIKFRSFWQINRNLLLMFLGFAFGIITIFITPMQGWYYWSLPFFIYFLIKENHYTRLMYWLITGFYFLYFLIIPASDYTEVFQLLNINAAEKGAVFQWLQNMGVDANTWVNTAATLLQTGMIGFCWFIYRYGISQVQHHKMLYQPCMIGISGDSASGKTTLATSIAAVFGNSETSVVNGDDLHRWERGHTEWNRFTHLNPKANLLHLNLLHQLRLKKGKPVTREKYDHDSGMFTAPQTIPFNRVIVFEGLHSFFLEYQQQLFDLKIFLDPDEQLRSNWKIKRDGEQRGYTEESVMMAMEKRKPDAGKFIIPQRELADIIISIKRTSDTTGKSTSLHISCLNHFYLDNLVAALEQQPELEVHHRYEENGQYITCTGAITLSAITSMGAELQEKLDEMGFPGAVWAEGYDGMIQLFVLQVLFYKMQLHAATHSEAIFN